MSMVDLTERLSKKVGLSEGIVNAETVHAGVVRGCHAFSNASEGIQFIFSLQGLALSGPALQTHDRSTL